MRRAVAVAIASSILMAACENVEPRAPSTPVPAPEVTPAAPPPPTRAPVSDVRVDAWQCADDLRPVTLYDRDRDSIEMYLRGELRTLQRTASVPPAYSDGAVTFRLDPHQRDAQEAILQMLPMRADCRRDPVASHELDAWQRGVRVVGRGNEPGWLLELHPRQVVWVTDYGTRRLEFDIVRETGVGEDLSIFARSAGQGELEVELASGLCVDDGDVAYPASMRIRHDGRELRGCARRLRDPGLPGFERTP